MAVLLPRGVGRNWRAQRELQAAEAHEGAANGGAWHVVVLPG